MSELREQERTRTAMSKQCNRVTVYCERVNVIVHRFSISSISPSIASDHLNCENEETEKIISFSCVFESFDWLDWFWTAVSHLWNLSACAGVCVRVFHVILYSCICLCFGSNEFVALWMFYIKLFIISFLSYFVTLNE